MNESTEEEQKEQQRNQSLPQYLQMALFDINASSLQPPLLKQQQTVEGKILNSAIIFRTCINKKPSAKCLKAATLDDRTDYFSLSGISLFFKKASVSDSAVFGQLLGLSPAL